MVHPNPMVVRRTKPATRACVIGNGIDSNKLLKKLKKKVGEAKIVELTTHDTFEAVVLPLLGTK